MGNEFASLAISRKGTDGRIHARWVVTGSIRFRRLHATSRSQALVTALLGEWHLTELTVLCMLVFVSELPARFLEPLTLKLPRGRQKRPSVRRSAREGGRLWS